MGEYAESFTVDADTKTAEEISRRYFTGFGFKVLREEGNTVIFEKGSLRRNIYTFSFEEAYKQAVVSIVGDPEAPVSTVSVSFSLPYLRLRKNDVSAIKSMIKALRERISITTGYRVFRERV
jgi:hypothetical protein